MATNGTNGSGTEFVVVGTTGGVTVVDPSTPLKRLNYFDGKFLRASDFDVEQSYLRQLVAISNQGLGPGVVYGYDTTLGSGDTVQIGPGLAMDPSGHVLLLQSTVTQSIQALIDASKKVAAPPASTDASGKSGTDVFNDCVEIAAPPPSVVVPISDIYVIAICAAEALCGTEDVYGKLCEEACVTSRDRPYRLEGVVLRAIPLQLVTPFPTSKAVAIDSNIYLRSKVAHSWYGDEVRNHPDAISRAGLLSHTWCLGAGYNSACCEVPLAVVARAGLTTVFLDAWIVRRERIDTPPKRYWQWKMRMRPWDVFLAQVLQFQCQLADVLGGIRTPGDRAIDPCAPHYQALTDAIKFVDQVRSGLITDRAAALNVAGADRPALLSLSLSKVSELQDRMRQLVAIGSSAAPQPTDRILIRLGMIETPSFGYLPVLTGTGVSVNDQVRALLGDGLDLRFCITTADYIAHAGEEAQHMDRISLLQGLDDASNKPKVDILVPDGKPSGLVAPKTGVFEAALSYSAQQTGGLAYTGAAREEALDSGGTALYSALAGVSQGAIGKFQTLAKSFVSTRGAAQPPAFTGDLAANPFVESARTNTRTGTTIANSAFVAREFVARSAGTLAAAPGLVELPAPVNITTRNTADGLWLTARSDREIRSLPLGGQTPVHFRAVFGSRPSSPLAFELMFHGTFAVTALASAATVVVTGTLNGTVSVGIYQENQSQQKTIEYLLTERFNWAGTTFTYVGDDQNGSVTLDVNTGSQPFGKIRLVRTTTNGDLHVQYRVAIVDAGGVGAPEIETTVARLELSANAGVVDPANARHIDAENALDIVQAALIVSEPGLRKAAEADLFPAIPTAARELRIDAVRDWVAFTRRRHKQCALDVAPAPVLPPRSYHVINFTAKSDDELAAAINVLHVGLTNPDPTKVAQFIQQRLIAQQREQRLSLVVSYQGGSAAAIGDLTGAAGDWKMFQPPPGSTIKFVAMGAKGETDGLLQRNRASTFEGAISGVTSVDPAADFLPILPYPELGSPTDADGVMFLVTQTPVVVTTERQHVFAAPGDFFDTLRKAAEDPQTTAAAWQQLLGRATDLKLASYTVAAGTNTPTVNDTDVQNAFKAALPGSTISEGLVLMPTPVGTQTPILEAVGSKIASDLTPGVTHVPSLAMAGTFPVSDAKSMLIVRAQTQAPVVVRRALLVYGDFDIENRSFGPRQPENAPSTLEFRNDVPQGNTLTKFLATLGANRPVNFVMLSPAGAVDAGAKARLAAVVAVAKPKKDSGVKVLDPLWSKNLKDAGFNPAGFDEVVFFSLNNIILTS